MKRYTIFHVQGKSGDEFWVIWDAVDQYRSLYCDTTDLHDFHDMMISNTIRRSASNAQSLDNILRDTILEEYEVDEINELIEIKPEMFI